MTDVTYETASGRLESIIERLDSGEAGLRETLELCREGRGLVEFCAGELDAVSQGLDALRLDELVARLESARGSARDQHLGAPGRSAAADRRLRARAASHERLERLRAPQHRHPPPRRRHGGRRRGRHVRGRGARGRLEGRAVAAARGQLDDRLLRRARRRARPLPRPAAGARRVPPLPALGLRVRGARPRAQPGRAAPPRGAGPRAAADDVRGVAAPRRAGLARAAAAAAGELPDAALQARPDADLDRRGHRRPRRHGRGGQRRLQGPLRGGGGRRRRGPGPLPPRRRGVPRRLVRGSRGSRRRSTRSSSRTATGSPGTPRSTASPTSRRCRSRPGW